LKIERWELKKIIDNVKEEMANLFAQERVTGNSGIQRENVFTAPFVVFYTFTAERRIEIPLKNLIPPNFHERG
jgi:hypothetical protein